MHSHSNMPVIASHIISASKLHLPKRDLAGDEGNKPLPGSHNLCLGAEKDAQDLELVVEGGGLRDVAGDMSAREMGAGVLGFWWLDWYKC